MWHRLTTRRQLNLIFTLTNGQCFGWWKIPVIPSLPSTLSNVSSSSSLSSGTSITPSTTIASSSSSSSSTIADSEVVFTGVIGKCVVSLRESGDNIEYYWHNPPPTSSSSSIKELSITDTMLAPFKTPSTSTTTTTISTSNTTTTTPSPVGKKRKRPANVPETTPISSSSSSSSSSSTTITTSATIPLSTPIPSLSHHIPITSLPQLEALLMDYFQLNIPLEPLYNQWSLHDNRMKIITDNLIGMRIIRQDPYECLFSFICSSNNNISRITQMLEKLRQKYGTYLLTIQDRSYYSWPTLEQLLNISESDLRTLGFGYRAKYITLSAKLLQEKGGILYLYYLRTVSRTIAQTALCEFEGVGKKVADCVALFSLDQDNVIPVDTHVWNIACCYYDRTLVETKSMTPAVYERVGDLFRIRYQQKAGWAHSLLFAAELPNFRIFLPEHLRQEMIEFRKQEKEEKSKKQAEKKAKKGKKEESVINKEISTGDNEDKDVEEEEEDTEEMLY